MSCDRSADPGPWCETLVVCRALDKQVVKSCALPGAEREEGREGRALMNAVTALLRDLAAASWEASRVC